MSHLGDSPPPSYWEPDYLGERDALRIERQEEAFYASVRGERCELCGAKTEADIDNGLGYVICLSETCEHQRSETL